LRGLRRALPLLSSATVPPSRACCECHVAISDRDEIQRDILAHLAAHPDGEDTLEGIAEWWLLERHVERRLHEVRKAVDGLVAEGLLECRTAAGSRPRFRVSDEARRDIRRLHVARERKRS